MAWWTETAASLLLVWVLLHTFYVAYMSPDKTTVVNINSVGEATGEAVALVIVTVITWVGFLRLLIKGQP